MTPSSRPPLEVVTLGTGGGPVVSSSRAGTATLVRVEDATYLFDCGMGSIRQYREHAEWGELRGIFLTHMHSDHIYDLGSYLVTGWEVPGESFSRQIAVRGPAASPSIPAFDDDEATVFAERVGSRVSHGTAEAVDALLHKVFGADIFIRMADEGRGEPTTWIDAQDIVPPPDCAADPVRARCPDMEPFEVYRDELVTISAILVDHRLCYPAYGFRLDSAHGSVVISGDTTECDNMVRLAKGADILRHEVMAFEKMVPTIPEGPRREGIITHILGSHTAETVVGKIADRAGVGRLVLTHIVPNLPAAVDPQYLVDAASVDFAGPVDVAEDGHRFAVATTAAATATEGGAR